MCKGLTQENDCVSHENIIENEIYSEGSYVYIQSLWVWIVYAPDAD